MAKKAKRAQRRRVKAQSKQKQNQFLLWIGLAAIILLLGVGGFMWASSQNLTEPVVTEQETPTEVETMPAVSSAEASQDAPAAAAEQETPVTTPEAPAASSTETGQDAPAAAPEPLPAEISVDQAYEMYQNGAFVLDVRTPGEWDEYHAPNTTLIPLDELEARASEVPRDQEVVLVCRSGNRSQVALDILTQAGLERITSMRGGLKAWRSAGYPVE